MTALRGILGVLSDPVLLLDRRLHISELNPAARQLLGVTPGSAEALRSTNGSALLVWLTKASTALNTKRLPPPAPQLALPDGRVGTLTLVRLQAGHLDDARWMLQVRVGDAASGSALTPLAPLAVAEPAADWRAELSAEHAAREHAERWLHELEQWLDLSPMGMALFDETGLLLRSNANFAALSLELPATLHEAPPALQQLLGWHEGRPRADLQPGARQVETQCTLLDPQGRTRWLRSLVRCHATQSGHRRYMAVIEDRSLEEERDLAHQQIDALMDTAGVGLATFQQDAGWLRPRGSKVAAAPGATPHSLASLQGVGRDIVEPGSLPEFERLQQALKKGDKVEVRYAVRHPELGLRWLLTRVEPGRLASGQRTTSVVTLDVTVQQQAQARNAQLLHELTTIIDSTSVGIAYLRGHHLVRCNQRFEQMLSLPAHMPAGTAVAQLFIAQSELLPQIDTALLALDAISTFEVEFVQPASAERTQRWLSLSLRRVLGSSPMGHEQDEAIAVVTDISRLKMQQAELQALAHDRELMFSLSDVGIAILRHGRIERANGALAMLSGYRITELIGLEHARLFESPEDFRRHGQGLEDGLRRHGRWSGERRLKRQDGSGFWVQVSKRLMHEGDPDGGVIASYVSVDERWRAQQSLLLQTERTRAILDSVLVGIVTVGRGGIEWMNRSARRMFGGDLAEFVGQPMSIVATPEPDHPLRQTHYLDELTEGQAETFECRLRGRDGREFWVVGNAVVTGLEASGRQLTYALLDIERRRQAEALTLQAQASLQRIIETAPLAISLHDAGTLRVERLNQVAAALAGRPAEQVLGLTPEQMFGSDKGPQIAEDMRAALHVSEVTQREYRLSVDGQPRVWDARYLPLIDVAEGSAQNGPDQLLLVASDVTEQRAAEEARLQAAIAQRELLVKEVHHRIKNNLQGVAGLLQQIAQRRPEVKAVINEAVGQVQAIAQVYGLQVGAAGPLRLRNVIEAITGSVQRMFGRSIAFSVEGASAHQWALPEAESIPIALSLNELLTNAIKHSSAEGSDQGQVSCRLVCGEDQVVVQITNSGHLPAGFALSKVHGGVSGLGLVRALLPRRSAKFTMEQQGGEVLCSVELKPPGVTLLEPL
nr:PAS domain S-box protein [uncultured Roseateles sp.]